MSLQTLLVRASRKPVRGAAFRRRTLSPLLRARLRSRRDPAKSKGKPSSDAVWELVEKMMAGNADAAILLDSLIGDGLTTGSTRFVRVTRKAWKMHGRAHPAVVQAGAFAAITPGRSIVLFGIKKEYKTSDPPGGVMRGYLRRFKIGDTAEYDSYNLVYLGTVTGITAKTVTVQHPHGPRKSVFDIERFHSKNYDLDVAAAVKRNQSWSD